MTLESQEKIEQSFMKGFREGKAEGKAELIYAMFKNGLTVEEITEICDITKEELINLANGADK